MPSGRSDTSVTRQSEKPARGNPAGFFLLPAGNVRGAGTAPVQANFLRIEGRRYGRVTFEGARGSYACPCALRVPGRELVFPCAYIINSTLQRRLEVIYAPASPNCITQPAAAGVARPLPARLVQKRCDCRPDRSGGGHPQGAGLCHYRWPAGAGRFVHGTGAHGDLRGAGHLAPAQRQHHHHPGHPGRIGTGRGQS
ncbi:hypothetical protein D9M71_336600 [compost metagenome]